MTKLCNSVLMVAWGAKHKKNNQNKKNGNKTDNTTTQHFMEKLMFFSMLAKTCMCSHGT